LEVPRMITWNVKLRILRTSPDVSEEAQCVPTPRCIKPLLFQVYSYLDCFLSWC
jgi:hypothetical protein